MPKTASSVEKANRESLNLKDEQIKQLKRLFPEVVADGKVNWEKLKAILGEAVDTSFEKFSFTWAGKGEAIRNVLVPSKATLRPNKKESIRFDESQNVFIEGDNLEVLKLFQNAYFEKVKMIYIDPPYNKGDDRIYRDNYFRSIQNYLEQTSQVDSNGNRLQNNTESSGRFHSDWLNMMYPRLKLAWNLLKENGVIFVSIDNDEQHRLRLMMDEIFGEENFVEAIVWNKRVPKNDKGIGSIHEYVLIYKKQDQDIRFALPKEGLEDVFEFITKCKKRKLSPEESEAELKKFYRKMGYDRGITLYENLDSDYQIWGKINLCWPNANSEGPKYNIKHPTTGKNVRIPKKGWRWKEETFLSYVDYKNKKTLPDGSVMCGQIWFGADEKTQPSSVKYLNDVKDLLLRSIVSTKSDGSLEIDEILGEGIFPHAKPTSLIQMLIESCCDDDNAIVMDCFAGSGTTGHAVLNYNKSHGKHLKFICVQLPEPLSEDAVAYKAGYRTIAEVGKERLRRVIKGYGDNPRPLSEGFKVFKLDESNYPENQFEYDPELSEKENEKAYKAYLEKVGQLDLFSKASETDLVYENVIKEGLDLNSKITEMSLGKNKVFQAKDEKSEILVCLDSKVADATVKALSSDDYQGKIFICYDKAVDDSAKANLGLHLSLRTI